jgi:PD-(D/E)XK endonuclease
MSTTAKGDVAEQAVVLALMAAGKTVLKPISNGLRYDLVIDNLDGSFTRVQCKTRMLKRGGTVLAFRAYNADARRPSGVSYQGQVDAFGVYCPWRRRASASGRGFGLQTAMCWNGSGGRDSNPRPLPWQGSVLPLNYLRWRF